MGGSIADVEQGPRVAVAAAALEQRVGQGERRRFQDRGLGPEQPQRRQVALDVLLRDGGEQHLEPLVLRVAPQELVVDHHTLGIERDVLAGLEAERGPHLSILEGREHQFLDDHMGACDPRGDPADRLGRQAGPGQTLADRRGHALGRRGDPGFGPFDRCLRDRPASSTRTRLADEQLDAIAADVQPGRWARQQLPCHAQLPDVLAISRQEVETNVKPLPRVAAIGSSPSAAM